MNHGNGIWAVKSPSNAAKPKFGTGSPYEADDCGGSEVSAGSFEVGKRYKISAVGTSTRWQSLGARASSLGTTFVATAAGESTTDGKAELVECPLQSVDTADANADGSLTAAEKAAYLLYDICSCYHDLGTGAGGGGACQLNADRVPLPHFNTSHWP